MEDDGEEEDDEDLGEFAEVLMRGLNSYTGKGIWKSPLEKPVKKINRLKQEIDRGRRFKAS